MPPSATSIRLGLGLALGLGVSACATARSTAGLPSPPAPIFARAPTAPVNVVFEADLTRLAPLLATSAERLAAPHLTARSLRALAKACLPQVAPVRLRAVLGQHPKSATRAVTLRGNLDAVKIVGCLRRAKALGHRVPVTLAGRPAVAIRRKKTLLLAVAADAHTVVTAHVGLAGAAVTRHAAVSTRRPDLGGAWGPQTIARLVLRGFRPTAGAIEAAPFLRERGHLRHGAFSLTADGDRFTIVARLEAYSDYAARRLAAALRRALGARLILRGSRLRARLRVSRARAARIAAFAHRAVTSPLPSKSYRDALRLWTRACGCRGRRAEYSCLWDAVAERNRDWVGIKKFRSKTERNRARAAIRRGDHCLRRGLAKHRRRAAAGLRIPTRQPAAGAR